MSLEVKPFAAQYLDEAALLVSRRYARLCKTMPALPPAYADPDTLLPLLRAINQAGKGSAAFEDGQLKGFLMAWRLPDFQSRPCVFSPEWANAAVLSSSSRLYEALYAYQSAEWVAEGYCHHLISLFANDRKSLESWQWAGFGLLAVDAVRSVQPVPVSDAGTVIRQAGEADLDVVLELVNAMARHGEAAPIFWFKATPPERLQYQMLLQNPAYAVWLAYRGDEPAAFMQIGPANEDACTIIRDAKTASITGAWTRETVRGQGIATALLDRCLTWARQCGYLRCAVDFEAMNAPGRRFWLRYFEPVSLTLLRRVYIPAARP